MTDRIYDFLSTLTADEAKATLHRLVALLPEMEASEVTITADPDDKHTPVWYCPTCERHGVTVVEADASIRWNWMEASTYDDSGEYVAGVSVDDSEHHNLYYLCEDGNHVVKVDPTVDVSYG